MHVERYLGKISGPLLDRVAIHVFVRPVGIHAFGKSGAGEASRIIRKRVLAAREAQAARTKAGSPLLLNAQLPERRLSAPDALERNAEALLLRAQAQLRFSARGRGHILRVARTIADLEGTSRISSRHVAEAVQYRIREMPT